MTTTSARLATSVILSLTVICPRTVLGQQTTNEVRHPEANTTSTDPPARLNGSSGSVTGQRAWRPPFVEDAGPNRPGLRRSAAVLETSVRQPWQTTYDRPSVTVQAGTASNRNPKRCGKLCKTALFSGIAGCAIGTANYFLISETVVVGAEQIPRGLVTEVVYVTEEKRNKTLMTSMCAIGAAVVFAAPFLRDP